MTIPTPKINDHPFWQFSCNTYQDTKDVLLEMQAHHGLNINVILFCYWFCIHYEKTLSKGDVKHLLSTIHLWHETLINPLRRLRENLKQHNDLNWVGVIREDVLETELAAEKIEQLLIADMFTKNLTHVENVNMQNALSHVFQSIKFYCDVLYVNLSEKDCLDFIFIAEKIFPEMKKNDISLLAQEVFVCSDGITKNLNNQQFNELNLELFEP